MCVLCSSSVGSSAVKQRVRCTGTEDGDAAPVTGCHLGLDEAHHLTTGQGS
jgi:hypothetical protein